MKQICLETIITLIYQSRTRSADTIKSMCGGIFAAYDLDITSYNKELPSHLKSGHDPVPSELISSARSANIDDIDRAFDKIIAVENNHDSELLMVDNVTQWTIYDPDATDYMVKLMTPQRNGTYKPDMAFGAFLGYTIKLDQPETDSQKYRVAVQEQLKRDIAKVQPYIVKKFKITDWLDIVFTYICYHLMMQQTNGQASYNRSFWRFLDTTKR